MFWHAENKVLNRKVIVDFAASQGQDCSMPGSDDDHEQENSELKDIVSNLTRSKLAMSALGQN